MLGVDGPGMLLERLAGPTLADELLAGRRDAGEAGALLASLHARLHALPWPDGPLLHLDLHPSNVVLAARGPVVIDWTDARTGPGYRDHLGEAVARRRAVPVLTDHELARLDDARALAARPA
ncbi:phosphotransferase [Isoptericola sp. NPDC056605]|uniref:phosphotransferase n=1 Tax=Isoptericola sp. NPDC056605 TaxID=3345876 RepID=UPI0036B961BB